MTAGIRSTRILCPIDFSEFSRHALDCAAALAEADEARVIALHVFTSWPAVDVVPSLHADTGQTISLKDIDPQLLERHLHAFVAAGQYAGVEIESRVTEGANIHREILEQADALRADLIVMGSHGRSGFERLLLGSTTEKVLRKATVPVAVVPRRSDGLASGARAFKRILCPMDFSSSAIAAVKRAALLARKSQARLTVLHVIEVPAVLYEMPGFEIAKYREGAAAKARARLAELVPEAGPHGPDVMVVEGRTGREILRVAAEHNIDLIVMGVQGRHAIDLMVFGSTTHEVIRHASCPVLTIRREEAV